MHGMTLFMGWPNNKVGVNIVRKISISSPKYQNPFHRLDLKILQFLKIMGTYTTLMFLNPLLEFKIPPIKWH